MIAELFRINRKSALGLGMLLVAMLLLYKACDNGGVLTFKPRRQGQLETDGSGK